MTQPAERPLEYRRTENVTLRKVLVRWEKFRLLYNGLLVFAVVGATAALHPSYLGNEGFWGECVITGLIANIFFCLGPLVDAWLLALGRFHAAVGIVLFTAGTVLSFLLAVIEAAVGIH
jgi:hypothetical protein